MTIPIQEIVCQDTAVHNDYQLTEDEIEQWALQVQREEEQYWEHIYNQYI